MSRSNSKLAIISDPLNLTTVENDWIRQFHLECELHAATHGIDESSSFNVNSIAANIKLPLHDYNKEGLFVQAIWVTYLSILKKYLETNNQTKYKYADETSFLAAYHGMFDHLNSSERNFLLQTANWMSILFTMIPARKNKGLAMQIIPKLVEGWNVKYVTGSGQTPATSNRVHIFEIEGDTVANHRGGKSKSRKASNNSANRVVKKRPYIPKERVPTTTTQQSSSSSSYTESTMKRRRNNNNPANPIRFEDIPQYIYQEPINASKYRSHLAHLNGSKPNIVDSSYTGDISECTDADDDSIDSGYTPRRTVSNGSTSMPKENAESDFFNECMQLLRGTSLDANVDWPCCNNSANNINASSSYQGPLPIPAAVPVTTEVKLSLINPALLNIDMEQQMSPFDMVDQYFYGDHINNAYSYNDSSDILDLLGSYST